MYIDIFNGDADGIFSLHQYRLKNRLPEAQLITGVKRDIRLLAKVGEVQQGILTVFDISFDSNRTFLDTLLRNGNTVIYYDHHYAGDIPQTPLLESHIDPSPNICTSLIVNFTIGESYPLWAICGAFGDNLHYAATQFAKRQRLSEQQTTRLRELGELFNYNGYGACLDDLLFHPLDLYKAIQPYSNPLDFLNQTTLLPQLRSTYHEDLAMAMRQKKLLTSGKNEVYIFPNGSWSRRISGIFSNLRARNNPHSAHVVVTENTDQTLMVSVRAPLNDKRDADNLCKRFPTGGGRAAAAGINKLPVEMLDSFLDEFYTLYS